MSVQFSPSKLDMVDQMHWHRRRGRKLLLAKVRMPIGRIGIFQFVKIVAFIINCLFSDWIKEVKYLLSSQANVTLMVGKETKEMTCNFICLFVGRIAAQKKKSK